RRRRRASDLARGTRRACQFPVRTPGCVLDRAEEARRGAAGGGVIGVVARLDRATQYAAAFQFNTSVPGILDHPLAAFAKASASPLLSPGEALAETGRG